jgi:hypothetical protein
MKQAAVVLSLATFFALGASPGEGNELALLRTHIQQIQDQNALLRVQIEAQERTIRDLLNRIERLEGISPATGGPAPGQATTARQEEALSSLPEPEPQALFIKGFADVNFEIHSAQDAESRSSNFFALKELDLLLTSQLSDKLSVLTEMVFHFTNEDEGGFFELERAHLTYSPRDFFKLRVGRMHTPIGYWNHIYHHGLWFQTTVARPDIHAFEDEGAILPEHSIGVEALGETTAGPFDLFYSGTVVNGRGARLSQIQNSTDENRGKGVNLHLSLSPHAVRGLTFGLSGYIDRLPTAGAAPNRSRPIDELILAGHLVWVRNDAELLSELVRLRHREGPGGASHMTTGLYAQGAYRWGPGKPYYRFDYIDYDREDLLFADRNGINKHTFGVRWDPATWMALKLEYRYGRQGALRRTHATVFQSAFTF